MSTGYCIKKFDVVGEAVEGLTATHLHGKEPISHDLKVWFVPEEAIASAIDNPEPWVLIKVAFKHTDTLETHDSVATVSKASILDAAFLHEQHQRAWGNHISQAVLKMRRLEQRGECLGSEYKRLCIIRVMGDQARDVHPMDRVLVTELAPSIPAIKKGLESFLQSKAGESDAINTLRRAIGDASGMALKLGQPMKVAMGVVDARYVFAAADGSGYFYDAPKTARMIPLISIDKDGKPSLATRARDSEQSLGMCA